MNSGFRTAVDAVIDEVAPERLMADVTAIAAENRSPGGPGEARAFDYIENALRGLPVTLTRFRMDGFVSVPVSAELSVRAEDGTQFEVDCITHSATASTPPDGYRAPLVWVGKGVADDFADGKAAGAVALVSGRPTVTSLQRAESGGCLVQVYAEGDPVAFHNLSTFAGNPTDKDLDRLSPSVAISVGTADGERLRALVEAQPVTATVRATVETGWRTLPLLAVDIAPDNGEPTFAFFGTHVDSWYEGAVDNGAGVAALLEIARIVAGRRAQLRRGARLLFWSGHEHGLYAGSSWYVDQHWAELYNGAVAALAIDSPGAANPTHLARSKVMDELADAAAGAARLVTGWDVPTPKRPVSGEQPLWRIGVPSLHPDKLTPDDRSWMHTFADQLDLIDPRVLADDTRIHLAALWEVVASERLPLRYDTLAGNLAAELTALSGAFDLSSSITLARELEPAAAALDSLPPSIANDALRRLGRALIPTLYTHSGCFDLDTLSPKDPLATAPTGLLVGLRDAAVLGDLERDSWARRGAEVRLVRQRNRLDHALRTALGICAEVTRAHRQTA